MSDRFRPALALALALLLAPGLAAADPADAPAGPKSEILLTGLGLLGGAACFTVGAMLGAGMAHDEDYEFSGMEEAYYVGSTLGALGLAAGVHVADDSQGNLGLDMLTSLGVGATGYFTLIATKQWLVLPATVLAQLAATVAVERSTARRNIARKQSLSLSFAPIRDGAAAAVSFRF